MDSSARFISFLSTFASPELAAWLRTAAPKRVISSLLVDVDSTPKEYLNLNANGKSSWILNEMPTMAPIDLRLARIQMSANRNPNKPLVDPLVWVSIPCGDATIGTFVKYSFLDANFPVKNQIYALSNGDVYRFDMIIGEDVYVYPPERNYLGILINLHHWDRFHPLRVGSDIVDPGSVFWSSDRASVGGVNLGVDPYRKSWVGWLQQGKGPRLYLADDGKMVDKSAQAYKFNHSQLAQNKLSAIAVHPYSSFNLKR